MRARTLTASLLVACGLSFVSAAAQEPAPTPQEIPTLDVREISLSEDARPWLRQVSWKDPVLEVAWGDPRGGQVIAVSPGVVTAWDWSTGREVWRRRGNWRSNDTLALGGGQWLIVGSRNRLRAFDLPGAAGQTDPEFETLLPIHDQITALDVDLVSRRVVAGTKAGRVCRWDFAKETLATTCYPAIDHTSQISAVALAADGERIVVASAGTLTLYKLPVGWDSEPPLERLVSYSAPWGYPSALALTPDGERFALGNANGQLWTGSRASVPSLQGSLSRHITALRYDIEASLLIVGDQGTDRRDGQLTFWHLETAQAVHQTEAHPLVVRDLALDPTNRLIATAGSDGSLRLWSMSDGSQLRALEGHASKVERTALSPDGRWLVVVDTPFPTLRLWDLTTGRETFRTLDVRGQLQLRRRNGLSSLAVANGGEVIALGFQGGQIHLLSSIQGAPPPPVLRGTPGNKITSLAFEPSGERLASGSHDETVRLWNLTEGRQERELQAHSSGVQAVDFDGQGHLLSSAQDHELVLWNLETGKPIATTQAPEAPKDLAYDPGYGWLIALNDGQVLRWDDLESTPRSWSPALSQRPLKSLSLGGSRRAWMDSDRYLLVQRLEERSSPPPTTLESSSPAPYRAELCLLGGARGAWIGCQPSGICLRADDGTLLVKEKPQGDVEPFVEPTAENVELRTSLSQRRLELSDGSHGMVEVTVENTGEAPVGPLWLRRTLRPEIENDSVLFWSTHVEAWLEPGESTTLGGGVSVRASSEQPHKQLLTLGIEVRTPTTTHSVGVLELSNLVPSIAWGSARWNPQSHELRLQLENVGEADLNEGQIRVSLDDDKLLEPVPASLPAGAKRWFKLSASDQTFDLDETRFDVAVYELDSSPHAWFFEDKGLAPRFIPRWLGPTASVFLVLLGLAFLGWQVYFRYFQHPLARSLAEDAESLWRVPAHQMPEIRRILQRTGQLDDILANAGVQPSTFEEALAFLAATSQTRRAQLLSAKLSLHDPEPLGDAEDLWRLTLIDDFALNLGECLLYLPESGTLAEQILSDLATRHETKDQVTLVVAASPQVRSQLAEKTGPENSWVAPSPPELTKLLLSRSPMITLAEVIARHVAATKISPYQTDSGLRKESMFFGRDDALSQILQRDPSNYLLVGGRKVGKSSLLRALKRRLDKDPKILCHYFVLSDELLFERLAWKVGLRRKKVKEADLRTYLAQGERRRWVLIDEVDPFIRHDQAHDYTGLRFLQSLSEEGICYFILAGYWDLFAAVRRKYQSPIKNFGNELRIGALEPEACRKLAKVPMRRLGVHFSSDDLVEHLIEECGYRANLISVACNELINNLGLVERSLGPEAVEDALHSSAMYGALEIGTFQNQQESLERTIIYATVEREEFSFADLLEHLRDYGLDHDSDDLEKALRRLELSCVLRQTGALRYTFQVPLYRRMILEREPDRLLRAR